MARTGQRSGGGGGGSHKDTEDRGRKLHHPEQTPATTVEGRESPEQAQATKGGEWTPWEGWGL